ncbi:MAG: hypothetical protein JSV97_01410, partial [candidate division WOR-3 bacterium]
SVDWVMKNVKQKIETIILLKNQKNIKDRRFNDKFQNSNDNCSVLKGRESSSFRREISNG